MDDDAIILMVNSNLPQDKVLPSEMAWALRMKLEALCHRGRKVEDIDPGTLSVEVLVEQTGKSKNQVYRFMPLTELVPTLLDMLFIVSRKDILAGHVHHHHAQRHLVLLSVPVEGDALQVIPERRCTRTHVVIEGSDYSPIGRHYARMLEAIEKEVLGMSGDSLEITIFNQYDRHYVEIWIPVEEQSRQ